MSIPTHAAMIDDRPWLLARLLGARWRDGRTARFSWGEWSRQWGLSVDLINWSEDGHWSLKLLPVYGCFYIKLGFLPKREPKEQMLDSWGFSWSWDRGARGDDVHLHWGHRTKILHMPWSRVHIRHDMLCDDGVWRKHIGSWQRKEGDPLPASETHHYRYVCRDGTVQDDIEATITVDEREWRPWLTQLLPWPRLVRRSICIEFSKEVGNQRGSWKGGTVGCSYEMRPGETPAECLHRMRRYRSFDR